ncbi:MAG: acyl-CoA thioesterase/BAAT N-terminal domain-containing protein [Deltaproteobacteria bacterium]|nr:acyl-CoA thioesterase/BAAT N-terminal domain-containing protein [Deltaproteobacteria bacterium]
MLNQPRIIFSSDEIVLDRDVTIRLTGFAPGSTVTLRAELIDDKEAVWKSEATFITDWIGSVDLTQDAPISGSYEGIDGYGIFWSMAPVPPEKYDEFKLNGAKDEGGYVPPAWGHAFGLPCYESDRPEKVRFEAMVDGKPSATAKAQRDSWKEISRFYKDVL